jgi:hypothetical protein
MEGSSTPLGIHYEIFSKDINEKRTTNVGNLVTFTTSWLGLEPAKMTLLDKTELVDFSKVLGLAQMESN